MAAKGGSHNITKLLVQPKIQNCSLAVLKTNIFSTLDSRITFSYLHKPQYPTKENIEKTDILVGLNLQLANQIFMKPSKENTAYKTPSCDT